jgi:hypothetical protein
MLWLEPGSKLVHSCQTDGSQAIFLTTSRGGQLLVPKIVLGLWLPLIGKTVLFLQRGHSFLQKTTTDYLLLFIERKSKDMLKLLNRLASR